MFLFLKKCEVNGNIKLLIGNFLKNKFTAIKIEFKSIFLLLNLKYVLFRFAV